MFGGGGVSSQQVCTGLQYWPLDVAGGGGRQVNTFEQVSSVGNQMSVAGSGRLYREIQGIIGNGHMGTPFLNSMTDTCENITFPQLPTC